MTAVLIDTNVLVYPHDSDEPVKCGRAMEVLEGLHAGARGALSAQVLSEFFAVVTRPRRTLLTHPEAARQLDLLSRSWPVYELTAMIVNEAARGVLQHNLSFWDAQIWASARLNQVPVVFSEDFQDGRTIEGVRFVNPFGPSFSLRDWI